MVFKKPSVEDIFQILEVIISENFSGQVWRELDKGILKSIMEFCQFDIRQTINYMQMWMRDYKEGQKADMNTIRDNLYTMNTFEATRRLLNIKPNNADLQVMKALFFVDYSLMDAFVFENYLNRPVRKDANILEQVDEALESFKLGDQANEIIKREQNYQLLPDFVFLCGIQPVLQFQRTIDFAQFPMVLGKIASKNKKL